MMPTNDINIDAYLKTTTIVRDTIENRTALHINTKHNTTTAHIKPATHLKITTIVRATIQIKTATHIKTSATINATTLNKDC